MFTIRSRLLLCVGLTLFGFCGAPQATADETPAAVISGLYKNLLGMMKEKLSRPIDRYERIGPLVQKVFNVPLMAELAVGPRWNSFDEAQRERITTALERYIAAFYAYHFDSYSGEQLQVTGEKLTDQGTMVTSQIIGSDGKVIPIDYLMVETGGTWKIANVLEEGYISRVAVWHSEFNRALNIGSVGGVIGYLNKTTNKLLRQQTAGGQ